MKTGARKRRIIDAYQKTKDGVTSRMYGSQMLCAMRRGHAAPEYTLAEFRKWVYSDLRFHKLYDSWVASGYNTRIKPSVDRIDDSKSYTFDNIRIITWRENNRKPGSGRMKPIHYKFKY